jgi:hypothetical protein
LTFWVFAVAVAAAVDVFSFDGNGNRQKKKDQLQLQWLPQLPPKIKTAAPRNRTLHLPPRSEAHYPIDHWAIFM